jgi:hypothetical protein
LSGVLLALGWTALTVAVTFDKTVSVGVAAGLWCSLAFIAVAVWRYAFVPYVTLTADALVIQNPYRSRTIAYGEISRARASSYGILIRRRQGFGISAWAVQKSNYARTAGRHTRADDLVEAIMLRVQQSNSQATSSH